MFLFAFYSPQHGQEAPHYPWIHHFPEDLVTANLSPSRLSPRLAPSRHLASKSPSKPTPRCSRRSRYPRYTRYRYTRYRYSRYSRYSKYSRYSRYSSCTLQVLQVHQVSPQGVEPQVPDREHTRLLQLVAPVQDQEHARHLQGVGDGFREVMMRQWCWLGWPGGEGKKKS